MAWFKKIIEHPVISGLIVVAITAVVSSTWVRETLLVFLTKAITWLVGSVPVPSGLMLVLVGVFLAALCRIRKTESRSRYGQKTDASKLSDVEIMVLRVLAEAGVHRLDSSSLLAKVGGDQIRLDHVVDRLEEMDFIYGVGSYRHKRLYGLEPKGRAAVVEKNII